MNIFDLKDHKVGGIIKDLAVAYGMLSELGAIIVSWLIASNAYEEFITFIGVFLGLTLGVAMTTALLYAAGVVVDNIVLMREKIVGTDEEIRREVMDSIRDAYSSKK